MWETEIPNKGVEFRYPAAQETTRSRIGIPASASAMEAALIHAALVPAKSIRTPQKSIFFLKLRLIMSDTSEHDRNKLTPSIIVYPQTFLVNMKLFLKHLYKPSLSHT
jgi:hypothetical protein